MRFWGSFTYATITSADWRATSVAASRTEERRLQAGSSPPEKRRACTWRKRGDRVVTRPPDKSGGAGNRCPPTKVHPTKVHRQSPPAHLCGQLSLLRVFVPVGAGGGLAERQRQSQDLHTSGRGKHPLRARTRTRTYQWERETTPLRTESFLQSQLHGGAASVLRLPHICLSAAPPPPPPPLLLQRMQVGGPIPHTSPHTCSPPTPTPA